MTEPDSSVVANETTVGGIVRGDDSADSPRTVLDGLAGRIGPCGFGETVVADAVAKASRELPRADPFAERCLPDSTVAAIESFFAESKAPTSRFQILPGVGEAFETAIEIARTRDDQRHRIVGVLGSDHGRTAAGRAASGIPSRHLGFGPIVAGFRHVAADDADGLLSAVDSSTAAVLLSSLLPGEAGKPLASSMFVAAREACDRHDALLIIDESFIPAGTGGRPFVASSELTESCDLLLMGCGLFGGLPGGLIAAGERVGRPPGSDGGQYPILAAALEAVLTDFRSRDLLALATSTGQAFARELAQKIGDFPFVRDLHVLGTTIGIETDINSDDLVEAFSDAGVRVNAAGPSAVLMHLPAVFPADQSDSLIEAISTALDSAGRVTAPDPDGTF